MSFKPIISSTPPRQSSRPSSPCEKRSLGVPSIVLTEAHCDRPCSPAPKQIVLLNPSSGYRRGQFGCGTTATMRSLALVCLLALAAWHLYMTLDVATFHMSHAPDE